MNLVVDANVIVKWFAREEDSPDAELMLEVDDFLIAPAHALAEVGQVLVRLRRDGKLSVEAFEVARITVSGSFLTIPLDRLFESAIEVAWEARQTVYDALYVAAALRWDTRVVTADRRLMEGLVSTDWRDRVVHLHEWAAAERSRP